MALTAGLIVAFVVTIVALAVLWPRGEAPDPGPGFRQSQSMAADAVSGEVVATYRSACAPNSTGVAFSADDPPRIPPGDQCDTTVVRLDETYATILQTDISFQPGDQVLLSVAESGTLSFLDMQRTTSVLLWLALAGVAVVVVGAMRGLRAILGLGFTLAVISVFLVPALLRGGPPIPLAITAGAAILYPVMFLVHGANWKSASALAGTLISVGVSAGLAQVSIGASQLRGLGDDSNLLIQLYLPSVSVAGLMLAGFIIGTLGALNDATVSQASTVAELAEADSQAGPLKLFTSAMRVGQDHIASMVYTLVLAYIGAALPMTLLLSVVDRPLLQVLTSDVVATELLRSAIGILGLTLAVPVTTMIAAWTARSRT
ncbi:YibE/F family protein [Corynebacterium mayonis]|uniref:YibE/F family protein n=1 Tax=Corynebacterium mayonis TaxID=3062461 RepID=UPI003140A371